MASYFFTTAGAGPPSSPDPHPFGWRRAFFLLSFILCRKNKGSGAYHCAVRNLSTSLSLTPYFCETGLYYVVPAALELLGYPRLVYFKLLILLSLLPDTTGYMHSSFCPCSLKAVFQNKTLPIQSLYFLIQLFEQQDQLGSSYFIKKKKQVNKSY